MPRYLLNRLMRDNMQSYLENKGYQRLKIETVAGKALQQALQEKIREEASEAADARTIEHMTEELADLQEVIDALMNAAGITRDAMEQVRAKKRAERGGFDKGLLLVEASVEEGSSAHQYFLDHPEFACIDDED